MESVLEHKKEFEHLVIKHDPAYGDIIAAIDIIKQFIIDHGLIIYGGSAIDYALRLHGDKEYPDEALAIPDLDFYSPDNVQHSYIIADILYKAGWENSRAINALHTETQRVDIMDNHFIADITYVPKVIFDSLTYLTYNNMRIIHPDLQRLDIHSSLAFPYDDPPREVIFARWQKDIRRFNKLAKYYPLAIKEGIPLRICKAPAQLRKYVLNGFLAYAIIYNDFVSAMKSHELVVNKKIIPAKLDITGDMIIFETIDQIVDLVSYKPEKNANELSDKNVVTYEPYGNILPLMCTCVYENVNITISSTHNRLVATNTVIIGSVPFRIVNVQYLLRHFLALSYASISGSTSIYIQTPTKIANTYLAYYESLMLMINEIPGDVNSPLFPSIHTYGNENISISREVALNKLYIDLNEAQPIKTPLNYYPARSIPKGVSHPTFNPEDTVFFRKLGRIIK